MTNECENETSEKLIKENAALRAQLAAMQATYKARFLDNLNAVEVVISLSSVFMFNDPDNVQYLGEEIAKELRWRGWQHYGIAALVEVLRYERARTCDPNSEFKFNNTYRAYMAREIMASNPELDGFFECRHAEADQ